MNIDSMETPTEHASIFVGSLKLEGMTTVSDRKNHSEGSTIATLGTSTPKKCICPKMKASRHVMQF